MSKNEIQDKFKELVDWGVAFGWDGFGQLDKDSHYKVSMEEGYLGTVTVFNDKGKQTVYNTYSFNDLLFDPDSKFLECIFGTQKVKVDVVPHHLTANFYLPHATYIRFICIQKEDYESIINYLLKRLEAHAQEND